MLQHSENQSALLVAATCIMSVAGGTDTAKTEAWAERLKWVSEESTRANVCDADDAILHLAKIIKKERRI